MLTLQSPCLALKGVGPALNAQLAKIAVQTVQDVLFHLPLRYQDRTQLTAIAALQAGDWAVVEGTVQHIEVVQAKRSILVVHLQDGSGLGLSLKFFHFGPWHQKQFAIGSHWRCFGEVKGFGQMLEVLHPDCQRVNPLEPVPSQGHLTPIYPSVAGISQKQWHHLTDQALQCLSTLTLPEILPLDVCHSLALPTIQAALQCLHRPLPDAGVERLLTGDHPAQQRLAFEELLTHQLCMRQLRVKAQDHQAPVFAATPALAKTLLDQLPFSLTQAQWRVSQDIWQDLAVARPMLRLVQGDVGSGKTLVAALACLPVLAGGYQVALMAPTELLAEQHVVNFSTWLTPLGFRVGALLGKHSLKNQQQTVRELAASHIDVLIGTHALFQDYVQFHRLGLVIIDEQHRFGVHQRLSLRNKGLHGEQYPHQLVMTATPIPRTLAMTAYADLDQSLIDELPKGRVAVTTVVMNNARREEMFVKVEHLVGAGQQVYWVCPLIEESEVLQCSAAEKMCVDLQQAMPNLRIALIHGRLKAQQKTQLMEAFKAGEWQVLVATTVIEVGVDVPNASLMVIENAERLGLAQLHQLRGRVGRGAAQSFCVLLYQAPLSSQARERLAVMKHSSDGFVIAERDLQMRGPGDVLGTRQTGLLTWRVADLQRDQALLPLVTQLADRYLAENSQWIPVLAARWLPSHLAYGDV